MTTPTIKTKVPKVAKVKNRMPAEVQITAEQILREAKERELELVPPPPKQKITDPEELQEYRLKKRKEFEDNIRKNRSSVTNWIKYASWEESQREIDRARSVYERALDVDHRNITLWLKYAEMEMKHKQVNHARNIWDRAITILPRAKQFWYKYTYMEEMIGNVAGARQVFERWIQWEPEEQAWLSYIKMELRYKELDRARDIYEKFVICHPEVKNWIRFASFEEHNNYVSSCRKVYERAVEFFGEDNMDEKLYVAFSKFEERQKEHERAKVIYKYALDKIPKEHSEELFKAYTIHEKRYGDRAGIEDIIVSKRRFQYEEEVRANPSNYDAWFDYLRLLETDSSEDTVREIYERAIANVPPAPEKRLWRRYIYLWINYALYEELNVKDMERTRQVYKACLDMIPHKKFTFAKVWLMFAHFEIRQKNLNFARKILGNAIGKCPKDKVFKGYIELELQLREFDRCRILYQKFLEFNPENCTTWMKFTELESILGDIDRARGIFDLAINQTKLDMPEVLWKAYIDFEIEQEEYDRTRALYKCLLQRTQHVKVWISFAKFELSIGLEGCLERARRIYKDANKGLRDTEEKEERLILLEAWKDFEEECGDEENIADVKKQMPNRVKRRRKIQTEDGSDAGWEEYYDYIFPNDESNLPNLRLLAMAKKWKQHQQEDSSDEEDDSDKEDVDDDDDEDKENLQEGEEREDGAKKAAAQYNDADYDDSSSSDGSDDEKKSRRTKETESKAKSSDSSDSSDSDK
ncbi:crooked neck-like protein 1 [Asterias rubens]|uniref:crooked neck-like protein 1 n=1 Tax=Asterias rubens TaxID=7604 RepID=UPI0014555249|nr:crooked neck-like protein 1 [Asterias rubens]